MNPRIEVIGSGTVGNAFGCALIEHGYSVHFTDVQSGIISSLKEKGLNASLTESAPPAEIYFLCVPTPTPMEVADYTIIRQACFDLAKRMKTANEYQLVVVKSTVLPGTTEMNLVPVLVEASNLQLGRDFGICVCPEYLREKTAFSDALNPPLIVIGENDRTSGDILADLLGVFPSPIIRMSIQEAEMQKYVHNLFNATKISFFNEIREIIQQRGLNTERIFEAVIRSSEGILNPEYGTRDWGPFGGSCLPKDIKAFLAWASETGNTMKLLRTAMEVNLEVKGRNKCVG